MEINIFLVLGFTLFIFAVTPGPGTLALLSISTSRGLASAIFFSVGMTLGDLLYLTIVIFSLNALADLIKPLTNVQSNILEPAIYFIWVILNGGLENSIWIITFQPNLI